MTNLVKGSIIALGTSSTVAIPLSLHLTNQPSTFGEKLTWDGKSHLSQDDKDDHWKAKFNDYPTEAKVAVKDYQENTSASSENIKKLGEWCTSEANKSVSEAGYENYSILCSTDLKTLKGRMISEKLNLASTDDDFKLLFINHKHLPDFLGLLNKVQTDDQSITKGTEVSKGQPKVKALCEQWFKGPFNSDWYERAKRRCVKSDVDTVEKKLNKLQGFKKIESDDDYQSMATRWNNQEKFTSAISAIEGTDNKAKLKKYCEDNMRKKLIELENYDEDIQKIRTFCDSKNLKGNT